METTNTYQTISFWGHIVTFVTGRDLDATRTCRGHVQDTAATWGAENKHTPQRHMASPSYSELPAEKDDERVRPECEEQLDSGLQEGCAQILMLCMRAEAMEIAAVVRMARRRNKHEKGNTAARRAKLQLHAKRPNLAHAICCNIKDRRNLPEKRALDATRTCPDRGKQALDATRTGQDRAETCLGQDQDTTKTRRGHGQDRASSHTQSNQHTTHTHAKDQRPTQDTRCRLPLV